MENQTTCQEPECQCCKGAEVCPNDDCKCNHIGFDAWIEDMEDGDQPEACTIDDPDCENCGS